MADENEILFKIEIPSEAETLRTLETITRQSKELREERKKLNLDTADGKKRIEEINKQLDANNNLIKQNTSALEKQRMNVGNYKEDIIEASKETKLFGVSLNDVKESFLKLANPVTAAVALVGGLVTAYIASAAGARDLESAQTSLTSNFKFLSNELARLVGADGKGGGLLSAFAFQFNLAVFGAAGALRGAVASSATNALKELEIAEIDARKVAKTALDQAEELRRIRDDEKKGFAERLEAARQVEGFINVREMVLVNTQKERLRNLKLLLDQDEDNLDLQKEIKQVELEIADIREDSQGKRTEAVRAVAQLNEQYREQIELEKHIRSVQAENFEEDQVAKQIQLESTIANNKAEIDSLRALGKIQFDSTEFFKKQKKEQDAISKKSAEISIALEQQKLSATSSALGQSASLFRQHTIAYKALASAQALIDTYRSATMAFATAPNYILGVIFAALAVVQGLAYVARINGIQFAKGGILTNRIAQDGMIIRGPSHAQGGVPFSVGGKVGFEAEGGEAIINKRSTAMYKDQLSAINVAGGGVPFALGGIPGGTTALTAGQTARSSEANSINRDLIDTISQLNISVAVTDINEGQRRVRVVEDSSKVL